MQWYEILVIIACALIVVSVIITSIVNKKKGKTSCGCDCSKCSACSSCKTKTQNADSANKK